MALSFASGFADLSGTLVSAGTGFDAVGGEAVPKSYAANQGLSWGSSQPADQRIKYTLKAGLEYGSETRIYGRLQGDGTAAMTADCYFIKIKPGSITQFIPDYIECWKRVGGQDYQIGSPYSLKKHRIINDSTVELILIEKQIIFRLNDLIEERWIDSAASIAGPGFLGFISMAGSHTTKFDNLKIGTAESRWCSPTGNDANSGSINSKYRTIGKLVRSLQKDEFGFIMDNVVANDYRETMPWYSGTAPQSGSSWEDAPTTMAYNTHGAMWEAGGSNGCMIEKGSRKFRVFYGIDFNGRSVSHDVVKCFNQAAPGSGLTPKYWRFQKCKFRDSLLNNGLFVGCTAYNPIYQGTSTPTWTGTQSVDYYMYFHVIDCESSGHQTEQGSTTGSHGFYIEGSGHTVERNKCFNNTGDGYKMFFGTSSAGFCNDNKGLDNICWNNGQYGSLVNGGANNLIDGDVNYLNKYGATIWAGSSNSTIRNVVSYRNQVHNIAIEKVGGSVTNYIYNSLSYDGDIYGIRVYGIGVDANSQAILKNNYDFGNAQPNFYVDSTRPNTSVGASNKSTGASFVSLTPGSEDFHLTAEFDGGDDLSGTFTLDADGRVQPQRASWGIGPYAFPNPNNNSPFVVMDPSKSVTAETPVSLGTILLEDDDANIVKAYVLAADGATFAMTAQGDATIKTG